MEKVNVKVKGMKCQGCVTAVEKALNGSKGVEKANVDLASHSANIEFNPNESNLMELGKSVKAAGFELEF